MGRVCICRILRGSFWGLHIARVFTREGRRLGGFMGIGVGLIRSMREDGRIQ